MDEKAKVSRFVVGKFCDFLDHKNHVQLSPPHLFCVLRLRYVRTKVGISVHGMQYFVCFLNIDAEKLPEKGGGKFPVMKVANVTDTNCDCQHECHSVEATVFFFFFQKMLAEILL